MSDWNRNRLSVEELLTKLENNLHQCRLTGHQAKTLLHLVRAADEMENQVSAVWGLDDQVWDTIDNYRKLRGGGGT